MGSSSLTRGARKAAHMAALILLTMVVFGSAVPIGIAVLTAVTLLSVFGMAGSKHVRASVMESARTRFAGVKARIDAYLS